MGIELFLSLPVSADHLPVSRKYSITYGQDFGTNGHLRQLCGTFSQIGCP